MAELHQPRLFARLAPYPDLLDLISDDASATETNVGSLLKAPKGKLPYIRDDGAVVSHARKRRLLASER
jgi:hypothetical protein